MEHCDSIATLLRQRLAKETLQRFARELNLGLTTLWRFVNEGSDLALGTAEILLAHYGFVVTEAADAEKVGLWRVHPTRNPRTKRGRARSTKAKTGGRKTLVKKARKKARP